MTEPAPIPGPDEAEAEDRPVIVFTFVGVGMGDFSIQASESIQPAQVYALAFYVQQWAASIHHGIELAKARQEAERTRPILVPTPNRAGRRHPVD